jgi:CBS domain-containing protein
MILAEVVEFLGRTPPFSFFDEKVLREIASASSLEFYPKESTILRQNGPSAGCLRIIKKGSVRVFLRTDEGEDVLVDYLSEGECFGLTSLLSGDVSRDTVTAADDTVCYLVTGETVLRLIDTHAAFSSHFLKTSTRKLVGMVYREINNRSLLYGGGDKLLFTVALNDLATHAVVTAAESLSIRKAAELMARQNVSSLILLDEDGLPSGIITDRDLRNRVVAKGRSIDDPVSGIMSVTLIKAEARDYCFEALLKMVRYNIHHLLVVNRGEVRGMITNHDLMMLQGTSPLSVAREIDGQSTIDGLVPAARRINKVITVLASEGARAGNISRIITEVNDRLLRKVLEITEARLGPPPVSYCWIVFGSEGRKEQTFRTDQDNALVYDDPTGDEEKAREYFSAFSMAMKEALAKCGFPPCPANYMAGNPQWCKPLKVWKSYLADWLCTPTPQNLLHSLILLDFRPVYGDFILAEKMRAYLGYVLKNHRVFLTHMAGLITRRRPPLNFLKSFTVEKEGEHRETINIKTSGLTTIVDIARLTALDNNIYATSTVERLREVKSSRSLIWEVCDDLEQAFEFLMSVRIRHQFAQIQAAEEPDNYIRPGNLSTLDRTTLKETFRLIDRVQEMLRRHYNTWMVS